MTNTYNLREHGDTYERDFVVRLGDNFPRYENLWQRFIVPLTNRRIDGSVQLKEGIAPILEAMAMAHYSVYWHLGHSSLLGDLDKKLHFQTIFYHLGAAVDMVLRLIFVVWKIDKEVTGGDTVTTVLLDGAIQNAESLLFDLATPGSISRDRIKKQFNQFLDEDKPASIRMFSTGAVAASYFPHLGNGARKDYGEWNVEADRIRKYRNVLVHNPRIGLLVDTAQNPVIPRANRLANYGLWSRVINANDLSDFEALDSVISTCQTTFLQRTDVLWLHLVARLDRLSKELKYQQLARGDDDSRPPRPYVSGLPPAPTGSSGYVPGASGIKVDDRLTGYFRSRR
ncbi:MAG: hypothetical protein IT318_25845 [Anaerolineales bacterium]|nr:hypothetical protein [Anaerolineales bacterium]